jgi:hypothetical protein
MPKAKEKIRPVHEVRFGRIKAAVWKNETQNGTMYNATFSRLYLDGKNWRDSSSFGRDDLPLLSKVADRVHTWIFEKNQDQNGSSQESNGSANGSNGSSHEDF